jgi:ABC-type branched-subunit amino acid transport system substrate-binding protein
MGDDAYQAAHLAVFGELNRTRKSGQLPFDLVTGDDEGDPDLAFELVESYASDPRTVGIVYAGPAEVLPKAQPLLQEAGIPGIVLYEDLYSARLLRSHLFQFAPPYLWQARRFASYLVKDRGYNKVGALVQDSISGTTAAHSLRSAFGGRVKLRTTRYDPDDPQLGSALGELEDRNTQALVFLGAPAVAESLLAALGEHGATYEDTETALKAGVKKKRSKQRGRWAPQVLLFDLAMGPSLDGSIPAGTIAGDTYARGAYYLPVPSFRTFLEDFRGWWDAEPLGWQQRTYEAVLALGWAARRTGPDEDVAVALEKLSDRRFGGLDVTFGPDDHTSVEQPSVGLWVVPRPGTAGEAGRLPDEMPWVPLARGFSIDGETLDYDSQDWRYLVRNPPPPNGPSPRYRRSRFGVVTSEKDPVH